MMRSLWSGVAGLKTHQLEMDVIGNNIANVNTTSYKSQATGFADVLYQTVKNGTGAGDNTATTNVSQVGLGSKVSSIYTNVTKSGSMQTTGNVMDLMITGDSFFCVTPDVREGIVNFTRDGSFTIDAEGNLVTQNNGYYVMGQMGEGQVGGTVQAPLNVINRTNIDYNEDGQVDSVDYLPGQATSAGYFKGNIDKFDPSLKEGKTMRIEVFGTDGKNYTIKFKLTDAGDSEDNTYKLSVESVLDTKGNTVSTGDQESWDLLFDKHDGTLISPTSVNFTASTEGGVVGALNLDLSYVTNYAGSSATHSSTMYGYKGNTEGLQQGFANGVLTGISFGTDGSIYGKYSNGQTIKKGQIVVAEFNNAMGLEKVGDNLYSASLNSGNPIYMDITEDGGYMSSGVLESSNVDLAKEFTDMITTQRGFQANSKVITTSDEMLQVLRGLKR